jgi:hypothetical protein
MLLVSLDCPFLKAPSIFFNVCMLLLGIGGPLEVNICRLLSIMFFFITCNNLNFIHRLLLVSHSNQPITRVVAINSVLSNNIDEHRPYRGVMVRVLAMSGFEPLLVFLMLQG